MDGPSHSCDQSPIMKLPAEILSQVFVDSVDKTNNRHSNILSTRAPLTLRRICQSWRQLALNTPLLWATIIAPVIADHSKEKIYPDLDKYLYTIEDFIMRSGNCPLTISIIFRIDGSGGDVVFAKFQAIITKLLLHVHRWRYICLEIPRRSMWLVYARLSSGVPGLKSLALKQNFPTVLGESIDLSTAHHLEYLHIRFRAKIEWGGSTMHKMREMRVDNHSIGEVLNWLTACPSLTHFVFREHPNSYLWNKKHRSKITIHTLASLVQCHFDLNNNIQSSLVLNSLHLPALKFFSLSINDVWPIFDYSALVGFMERSHPALTVLNLNFDRLATAELHHCLRSLPSLIALRVHIRHFSKTSIGPFLAPSPTHVEPILCPNLKSLWLIGNDDAACYAVAKLVVHRWRTACSTIATRISILSLSKSNMKTFMTCPGVLQCVHEGLVFKRNVYWTGHAHQIVAFSD
ncbi:hypothetical protein BD410DRAFT_338561 [Rickenella mellea]|uniref:Uncharacterized protein n=1 Tax=Rickenella mellea TaxID=50990 RepID=A0A4Y7QMB6_9AGAM|nr:hypothetical protein BD410DRAFT_338561 [Rickenella mellea]